MIITLDYFNQHTGDYNTEIAELKTDCILSAQEEIEAYLGYPVNELDYSFSGYSFSDYQLALDAPISGSPIVKLDGTTTTDFKTKFNFLLFPSCIRDKKIEVTYKGGFITVPASVKLCAAEIATIKFENRNKQITVSAKQMPDGVSWSRVNHNGFDNILKSLDRYKI